MHVYIHLSGNGAHICLLATQTKEAHVPIYKHAGKNYCVHAAAGWYLLLAGESKAVESCHSCPSINAIALRLLGANININ